MVGVPNCMLQPLWSPEAWLVATSLGTARGCFGSQRPQASGCEDQVGRLWVQNTESAGIFLIEISIGYEYDLFLLVFINKIWDIIMMWQSDCTLCGRLHIGVNTIFFQSWRLWRQQVLLHNLYLETKSQLKGHVMSTQNNFHLWKYCPLILLLYRWEQYVTVFFFHRQASPFASPFASPR